MQLPAHARCPCSPEARPVTQPQGLVYTAPIHCPVLLPLLRFDWQTPAADLAPLAVNVHIHDGHAHTRSTAESRRPLPQSPPTWPRGRRDAIRRFCARLTRYGLRSNHQHQQPEVQSPSPPHQHQPHSKSPTHHHYHRRKQPPLSANPRHRSPQHHLQAEGRNAATAGKSKLDACPLPLVVSRLQPNAIAPKHGLPSPQQLYSLP